MKDPIIITAILKPKEGFKEQLLLELKKVQQGSREEDGCIKYAVHQSIEDQKFVLYEIWKDVEAVELHSQSSHYQEYRNNTSDIIASKEVYKLNLID